MLLFARVTDVKRLEWIDPQGRTPVSYRQWCVDHRVGEQPTHIGNVFTAKRGVRRGIIDIVVNHSVYPQIVSELNIFTQDLTAEGYAVQLDTISGMSPVGLRSHLASVSGIEGAIFVGDLPVAWFETNGFGNWEEFPHDLYFSDLNGTYTDNDADGIFDGHTGNTAPEIWVGRICTRNLYWDSEIRLLKNYFHKNHRYRTDSLVLPDRALSFVDDDWSSWTTCGLDLVYSNVTVINDGDQTSAQNYRAQLSAGYEWIHVCAHSSPWGHTFKLVSGNYSGTVANYEIFTLEPQGLFYNLFACSGTRYVEDNFSAGWYVFGEPYGLLAVGSSKTGSMLYFEDFYGPLGQPGTSIGSAFQSWFTVWGETDWDWFYGLNIIGDPTLKPRHGNLGSRPDRHLALPRDRADWPPAEVVGADPESDGFPDIAAGDDGRIWAVWESGRSPVNGRIDIYGASRSAGAWSAASDISAFYYWDYSAAVGFDNTNRPVCVWAGWEDLTGNYQYDIFYSVYDGAWSTRQLLHPLDPAFDTKPVLVKDGSQRLWAVWESRRNVNIDLYAAYFFNNAWSTPQQVTSGTYDETNPALTVDGLGRPWVLYVVKYPDRSEIRASYFNGAQWVATEPVSGNQNTAYCPTAATSNGRVWAAWQTNDFGNADIYASFFNDTLWSTPVPVANDTAANIFPDVTADTNGSMWLVYQSKSAGGWDIYSARWDGSSWSAPELVSNLVGAEINPRIACDRTNELWVAWQSYITDNWEITVTHQPALSVAENRATRVIDGFRAFPTPFTRTLEIVTPNPYQEIEIYDRCGIRQFTTRSGANRSAVWADPDIPAGVYFVTIRGRGVSAARKVLRLK
jgi:hypothetical protein